MTVEDRENTATSAAAANGPRRGAPILTPRDLGAESPPWAAEDMLRKIAKACAETAFRAGLAAAVDVLAATAAHAANPEARPPVGGGEALLTHMADMLGRRTEEFVAAWRRDVTFTFSVLPKGSEGAMPGRWVGVDAGEGEGKERQGALASQPGGQKKPWDCAPDPSRV